MITEDRYAGLLLASIEKPSAGCYRAASGIYPAREQSYYPSSFRVEERGRAKCTFR